MRDHVTAPAQIAILHALLRPTLCRPQPTAPDLCATGVDHSPVALELPTRGGIGGHDEGLGTEQGAGVCELAEEVHRSLGVARLLEGDKLARIPDNRRLAAYLNHLTDYADDQVPVRLVSKGDEPEGQHLLEEGWGLLSWQSLPPCKPCRQRPESE